MDLFDILQNHAAVFLLLLTRTTGIFLMSPFFGSNNISSSFRIAAAVMLSFILFPVVDTSRVVIASPSILGFVMAVVTELAIGWMIGYIAYLSFSAIHFAGKMMDMQVGFAIINVLDPTSGQQIPLIGSFLYNLTLIVFVAANGHYILLSALFESFSLVPVMSAVANPDVGLMIRDFSAGIFSTGVKIALPVTFSVMLTNVALGILARTMPQLNIFVIGVPMHIIVGLFMLAIFLPFYMLFLDVLFNGMYAHISAAIKALM